MAEVQPPVASTLAGGDAPRGKGAAAKRDTIARRLARVQMQPIRAKNLLAIHAALARHPEGKIHRVGPNSGAALSLE